MDARPTRRALLLAAAAAGLSACVPGRRRQPPAPDPDAPLLDAARDDELSLIARYDALIASHPNATAALRPLREEHVAHLNALGGSATATPTATATPPAASSSRGTPSGLVEAERAAARERAAGARRAVAQTHAQLLASIAGAEAAHGDVLLPAVFQKTHI